MTGFPTRLLAVGLVVAGWYGSAHPSPSSAGDVAGDATLTGTVTYRERVALPPDAIAEITLIDATIQDVAAKVVAKTTVKSEGKQVPLSFALHYDPSRIDKKHLYTARAVIRSGDELLWTTDIARAVITQGNPTDVEIMLTRVDPDAGGSASGGAGGSSSKGELAGSSWVLEELNGDRAIADVRVTLDFSAQRKATGNGSCNRYSATVDISGETIRFGAVGATRMACATAISLQEIKYFGALEGASRYEIDGDELSIYGSERRPLRFSRATP
jgi:putative lipoprotein